jgi:signal transduction histidine kinase/ActR/RegA family two-component response regulator
MIDNYLPQKKSIRSKLLTIIIGVTAFALVSTNIIELVSEYVLSHNKTTIHLNEVTKAMQEKISYYETENEAKYISDFMKFLEFDPYIDKACYYKNGKIFASYVAFESIKEYGQYALCPAEEIGTRSYKNDLKNIYETVPVGDDRRSVIGTLFIKYDLERDFEYLWNKEIISVITFFIALIFAYLLSLRVQNFLTKPIYHLSSLAATLAEKQDYSLRAKKFSDDEIGLLSESFNEMIEKMGDSTSAMQKAREEADHANKQKSSFLAMMSHEIRTPINGVMGTAELLSETRLTGRQREYVEIIGKSAATLFDLINDILDFSKIEAEKLTMEKIPFDLTEHIQDVIDISQIQVAQKGLQLYFTNNLQGHYHVIGDPVRIKQIVINLVSNAVKFTNKGSITITLDEDDGHRNTEGMKQIWVSIADTGVGIPDDRQTQIFESFTQADDATTRQYGGSGLGLSICKKLVTMMGGKIGVKSTEKIGSTFWFSIPMEITKKEIEDTRSREKPQIIANENDNRILLVEDNETNIMITSEILLQAGYDVTLARDGAEAISCYCQSPFSIILMDCQMPIMDGWEATQRIRAYEKGNHIKASMIVALTANAMDGDREKCIEAGMDEYLAKPFKKKELLDKLQEISTNA